MAVTDDVAAPPEELTSQHQDRILRAVQTTRENKRRRVESAPKPGDAKTIDEVILRGRSTGKVAETRRTILEKLVEMGGEFAPEAAPGTGKFSACTKFGELIGLASGATAGVLRSMADDNQLGIEKQHVRDVKRIYLVDPLAKKKNAIVKADEPKVPAAPKKKANGNALLAGLPPLPALGSNAMVFAQILEDDGAITLGFKDDTGGKFVTSVKSWQAPAES